MKHLSILFVFAVALAMTSCLGGKMSEDAGDSIKMEHAKLLTIEKCDKYNKVTIADPWNKGKVLHTYFLVKEDSRAEEETLKKQGTVVKVPLKHSMPFSTVHCAMICSDFNSTEAIAGVADVQYIKVPEVLEGVKNGKIADCGSSMQPDIEKIVEVDPDAILVSPFENSGGYGKLESMGIPLIECADYMEVSPLARVEWLRFYGMLYGKEMTAEKVIKDVSARYNNIKAEAQKLPTHPTVIMDKLSGGTWYVPGGTSTIGTMISDAGGKYIYADDKSTGSLSYNLEKVLSDAGDAQIWMMRYSGKTPLTLSSLLSENKGYSQMSAVTNQNVFGCNTETTRIFEETPFHPDLLLQDMYSIIKGDLSTLRYFHKLF